jgi:hypothetical protein
MQVHSRLGPLTLALSIALAVLPACRQQPPPSTPPSPTADTPTQVTPSADLKGASDHPDAPPAVGAMTAGQATGGARSGAMQPTAGDRASGPASAASS